MTRDLLDYQAAYLASDFESVQADMRKRKILEFLHSWQPSSLLEVGCGTDPIFRHYADGARFVVIEPGDHFAQLARQHAAGDPRIEVVESTLEAAHATLTGQTFDCILVSGLLHEVPNGAEIMQVVARLCSPHTRVHVNVPNARSFHRLLALEMGLISDVRDLSDRQKTLQQHHTFDTSSLASLCQSAGFAITEQGSYFIKPFTHAQMAALLSSGVISPAVIEGLYGMARHAPDLGSEIYVNLRLAQGARR